MKKVFLYLFLLAACQSFGQFQVNFPNHDVVLNDVVSWDIQKGAVNPKICLWVFGNGGYCAYSEDGAKTWKESIIDSQKRDIRIARRLSEALFVVAGGAGNDLAKYSTDAGTTWLDIPLPEKKPVVGYSLRPDGRVLVLLREYAQYWTPASGSFAKLDYPAGVYCEGASGDNMLFLWCSGTGTANYFLFYLSTEKLGSKNTIAAEVSCGDIRMERMAFVTYDGSVSKERFRTPTTTWKETVLPVSGKVSSTLVIQPEDRWHVGGISGQSAFIVKNGEVAKEITGFKLNQVRGCGTVEPETYPAYTNMIAVGEKGMIYSDYSQLQPASTGAVSTHYSITDTTATKGWSGYLRVSGSQSGASYKVYANAGSELVFEFAGTGSAWKFPATTLATETRYMVKASLNGQTAELEDKGVLKAIPNLAFSVVGGGEMTIHRGETAKIYLGSTKASQFYRLMFGNAPASAEAVGTGSSEMLLLEATPEVTIRYDVKVRDGEWADCFAIVANACLVTVEPPVGITNLEKEDEAIYPNPCSDYINYILPSSAESERVDIFDLSGQKIKSVSVHSGQNRIDVSGFTPGIYFLDGKKIVKK